MTATATRQLRGWLIHALADLGGTALRQDVLARVEKLYGNRFTTNDRQPLASRGGELAWRNQMSVARRELVEMGLLHPPEASGRGRWSLTRDGQEAYRHSLARPGLTPVAPLCPTFRAIASNVATTFGHGRSVGLVPWETTFTDNLLLHLALTHPGQIRVERFGAHREADTGADWEWWFHHHRSYVGFRMQAKRVSPASRRFALDQPAAARLNCLQVEAFADSCRRDGLPGLYCLYSDHQPGRAPGAGSNGACPHGALDHTQWGCALLPVPAALRHVREGRSLRSDVVLSGAWPWYRLVCQSGVASVTTAVSTFLATAGRDMQQSRDDNRGSTPPDDVRHHFEWGESVPFEHRPGLAGIVLVDADRYNDREDADHGEDSQ
ncbi:winged helix-turn-helix domain-containing protein [Micromonospora purpureochromogenes]|uniref:winged helix-turn-helix domain-containing protein n=1 Tax=Micromonospora purpureochromogenes TaxID=47872 RepID=UPI0033F52AF6